MDEPDINKLVGTMHAMDRRIKRLESKVFGDCRDRERRETDNAGDEISDGLGHALGSDALGDPPVFERPERAHSVPVILRNENARNKGNAAEFRKKSNREEATHSGTGSATGSGTGAPTNSGAGSAMGSPTDRTTDGGVGSRADCAEAGHTDDSPPQSFEGPDPNDNEDRIAVDPDNEKSSPSGIKLNVGRVLNVAGVCFLVVGAALLVLYSWRFMGTFIKVAIGLLAAASMVIGGEKLSKRQENKWYGQGLIGGGYSLAYFVVYGMQNITELKCIDSAWMDSLLLLGVAAGCMNRAVKKRSETIATMSTILAFATLSLSQLTAFSVVACGVLMVGLASVIIRMRWFGVFSFSAIASYLTYSCFTHPQIVATYGTAGAAFDISAAFLLMYWAIQNALCYFLAGDARDKKNVVVAVSIGNALAFITFGLSLLSAHQSELNYLFLFATGAFYLLFSLLMATRNRTLSMVTTLIGLPLMTASIPLKLDAQAVPVVLLLELALLVWAGLRFNLPAFRAFAGFLAVTLLGYVQFTVLPDNRVITMGGAELPWRVLVGGLAVAGYGLSAFIYRLNRFAVMQKEDERKWCHYLYFVSAVIIAWSIPATAASIDGRIIWWAFEGIAILCLIHRSSSMFHHLTAAAYLACSAIGLLGAYGYGNFDAGGTLAIGNLQVPTVELFLIAAGFSIASCYRHLLASVHPLSRRWFYHAYSIFTVIAMGLLCTIRFGFSNVSVVLTCMMAAVLVVSMHVRDGLMIKLATASFALALISAVTNFGEWDWSNVLPIIAIVYGVSALFGWARVNGGIAQDKFFGGGQALSADDGTWMRGCFGLIGSIMLTVALGSLLRGQLVSVAWAVEGIALIALGFKFDEAVYRFSGLSTFALLAGKLLFVDLADAPTVARIASFIVTGLAFLAGSYAYAWYRKNNITVEQR